MRRAVWTYLGCACLFAQPETTYTRDLTVTQTMDKDVPTIHIRNTYSAGASAWVVGCDDSSGR